jgi:hypothetical protein
MENGGELWREQRQFERAADSAAPDRRGINEVYSLALRRIPVPTVKQYCKTASLQRVSIVVAFCPVELHW